MKVPTGQVFLGPQREAVEQNGVKMGKRNNDGVVRAWGSREGADSAPGWWREHKEEWAERRGGSRFSEASGRSAHMPGCVRAGWEPHSVKGTESLRRG